MEPQKIDLHTHSRASDGTDTPTILVQKAVEANLRAMALTDHDTLDGLMEFQAAARNYPDFCAINGVEISSRYGARELHLVGLHVDVDSAELNAFLDEMRQERLKRAQLIAKKLTSLGYELTVEEVKDFCRCTVLGRPHFAHYLCYKYKFSSIAECFDRLLKRGAGAYVSRDLPNPTKVIEIIHAAHGVAIWAHPIYREQKERSWAKRVLKHLIPAGLDGIEAFYSSFSPDQTAIITKLAQENNLLLSGGSDYHGSGHADISIGSGYGNLFVSEELLEPLRQRHLDLLNNSKTEGALNNEKL